ncbi:NAD(P)/FAD-dependent oxidoreductase [Saccharospirillum impatiens]|uniref:NAD(P)/FAD-dependent oxidoreductase n=1 Tax=Saccharospirillum impatiens TaxID=169438 RepID=UPI0004276A17|nr:NAD(P)/FAD-dependent oxidoreductase [Saccharospirillum impatiens]
MDVIVIGAGVVGLAIARRFALAGQSVLVLEQHPTPGQETSSRNSEVLHAGIYYRPGSLKARLCVQGYEQLVAYCQDRHVPYGLPGKLILATDEAGEAKLEQLQANAAANGVSLESLAQKQVAEREPAVSCRSALWSPKTGIIDSHALMTAFQADIEAHDGDVVCHHRVEKLERSGDHWQVSVVDSEGERSVIDAGRVINAAGLGALTVARSVTPAIADLPEAAYAKGCYFGYSGRLPVSHLLYPTPEAGGLGIHLTLDLNGQPRFGPDVTFLDTDVPDYEVDPAQAGRFASAVQTYLPGLDASKLVPAYAGVRPKVKVGDVINDDFLLQGYNCAEHQGLINLFGIESPGLTASMAIADAVFEQGQ